MLTSSAITLTVNPRSDWTSSLNRAVLSPVRVADGTPPRCSSSTRFLAFRKNFVPAKGLAPDVASPPKACCSFQCVVVTLLLSLTQKSMAYRCAMLRAVISVIMFTKNVLTCDAPTANWGVAKACHWKLGWRKDQGQRLSVLAGCSIAGTAGRKLVSLCNMFSFG